MRKRVFGRQLKRDTDDRKQLLRNLMRSFILNGKLKSTQAKVAAIRPELERLVTAAKRKGDAAERDIFKHLANTDATRHLIREVAPRFADRPGGYTRVFKMGPRVKDAAPVALLQWVETVNVWKAEPAKTSKTPGIVEAEIVSEKKSPAKIAAPKKTTAEKKTTKSVKVTAKK